MWAALNLLDNVLIHRAVRSSETPQLCDRIRSTDAPFLPTLSSSGRRASRGSKLIRRAAVEGRLKSSCAQLAALDFTNQSEPPLWDVVGLGQAMVDISAAVDDDFVARAGIKKGARR